MESAALVCWFAKEVLGSVPDVIGAVGYLIFSTDTHRYVTCQTVPALLKSQLPGKRCKINSLLVTLGSVYKAKIQPQ